MRAAFLVILLGCAACSQPVPEQPTATAPDLAPAKAATPTDDFLDPAWFKVARLDTFSVRHEAEELVKLTPAQEKRYLQQAKAYSRYTPSYFYSLQQNTPARQEITVLTYDGEYMSNLWRLVYDARHKLISRQQVAGSGMDGGQQTTITGLFETPGRFRLTYRDELSTDDTLATQYEVDSTVTYFAVAREEFRQRRKSTYRRHYARPLPE
jgi:hypothetical protein